MGVKKAVCSAADEAPTFVVVSIVPATVAPVFVVETARLISDERALVDAISTPSNEAFSDKADPAPIAVIVAMSQSKPLPRSIDWREAPEVSGSAS